jgi:hypothetical protein
MTHNHHALELSCPPKVTVTQWMLTLAVLAIAGVSYTSTSYQDLRVLTGLLTVLSTVLVGITSKEALQTRLPGKFFVVGSTLAFFWVEALDLALNSPPFSVPDGVPVSEPQFGQDLIQLALVYVAVFQLALLMGYSFRPGMRWMLRWVQSRVDTASNTAHVVRYLLIACALLPLLLSYDFDLKAALEALLAARSGSGPESQEVGLIHYLLFFGMYGGALFFVEALGRRGRIRIWKILIGAVAALPFVMGGARHLWLFVALPVCIVALSHLRGKATVGHAARWIAVMLVIFVVIQLQYTLRTIGWREIGNLTPSQLLQENTTGQFTSLLFAETLVPQTHDYFLEPAELYFVTHWIPRQFWPEKPIMRSWDYYNQAYTNGGAFNVTPSVIGQFHINWGMLGVVFIGLWLGFLACVADRALLTIDMDRQQATAATIGMLYAFIVSSFRFYSPVYFTYVVFALLSMLVISRRNPLQRTTRVDAQVPLRQPSLP